MAKQQDLRNGDTKRNYQNKTNNESYRNDDAEKGNHDKSERQSKKYKYKGKLWNRRDEMSSKYTKALQKPRRMGAQWKTCQISNDW